MAASRGSGSTWSTNFAAALPDPSGGDDDRTGRPTAPRFFGRRRGKKLRAAQEQLLEDLLPELQLVLPGGTFDPRTYFAAPVWLEIGFGGGEHLAGQAAAHPAVGFIGCEVFVNGIVGLLRHVAEHGLANVRIWPEDVRRLLPVLPEASLERVFLLFPDPWHKARHAERRFVGPENLHALARVMADDAELRVASDDANYIDWSLDHLRAHPAFAEIEVSDRPPEGWIPTRYEQKALKAGRPCRYLRFRRRARSGAEKA
jgi:tRNA (guanine-N7-)-methyltransferase